MSKLTKLNSIKRNTKADATFPKERHIRFLRFLVFDRKTGF